MAKMRSFATPGRRSVAGVAVGILLFGAAPPAQGLDSLAKCLKTSGGLGSKCMIQAAKILKEKVSPADDLLGGITQDTLSKVVKSCNLTDARILGFRDEADIAQQIDDGCTLFAYELNSLVYTEDQVGLTADQEKCRSQMYKWLTKIRKAVTLEWGKKCTLAEYRGKVCDRATRDKKIEKVRAKAEAVIEKACGSDLDAINTFAGATLQDRIATFVDTGVVRGRHWAQRVFPPNNLGPTGELGAFRIGLTTLALEDPTRLNVPGDGPRPLVTEIYYPTTDADIVGVEEEFISVVGIELFAIPAYRDVALVGGPHPVVLFSHGNEGIRLQSFFFASVLASHGFIVLSPDHHGNTFVDTGAGIDDPNSAVNRPLDMSFLIDEITTLNSDTGNFFEGAFDLAKIGMSGHSFGGYTTFALAGGSFSLGTFTDARVKAIFPQAPSAGAFDPNFFATISVPTLIVGGSLDETTPFVTDQQLPFDNMVSGASVVGLANVNNAGHFTFSSFCEVPADILAFLGGFEEACEPRHIPWRHGQDLTMYLAVNFFKGVLNGNTAALDNLDPALIAELDPEDISYQSK